ncbi:uncharacterized protein ColSpa_01903 [Colletotrichum spaethianum]|uniref:Cas1p-like protein n=1 Tax=Colletotrichum spaethianum TaxID=700344 RepID=A0AA37NU71_9PEZI|nr:uncharacterized protein ColSpa_01903 [Colletotrichum spaethianum]GKT41722.1 hypothetical protein ColSpa_01903 [Colletotrichum spaethianum]
MRRCLLLAVAALSSIAQVRSLSATHSHGILTRKQGAVVDKRQNINLNGVSIDGNGNVNVKGNGAPAVEVTTVDLQNAGAVLGDGGKGSNRGNLIAGILDALNGNRHQGNQNTGNNVGKCPAAPPPVTVTKTVYQNASVPAPLTVFVTQAAPPPQIITQMVTQTPAAAAPPPAATPAASQPGLVIPGPPQAPPFAGLSSSSIPPPAAASPAPVAAEPAATQPAAALPQVGNPAATSGATTSLNLGGLRGTAANQPAADVTPPVAANPAQPQIAVSGLALTKSLQLGNLLQQTVQLQARETPPV